MSHTIFESGARTNNKGPGYSGGKCSSPTATIHQKLSYTWAKSAGSSDRAVHPHTFTAYASVPWIVPNSNYRVHPRFRGPLFHFPNARYISVLAPDMLCLCEMSTYPII
ncbi:hypothetical protein FIBSPDRAFT_1001851 [Athelia psychrophila]|uniref:Uncharacterized protein n=1 Tax=Athelia psychrophila TaxID=1759441 RepID=A0A166QJ58_9AGAM|nr:hypothetical protein FIBSPDRAFT_1001851 [Fibularhizoctonia sp. CBS 109695]